MGIGLFGSHDNQLHLIFIKIWICTTLINLPGKLSAGTFETDWDSQLQSPLFNDSNGLKKHDLWEAIRDIY